MQLFFVINHIVSLIKDNNRVVNIDSNTISYITAEDRSIGKANNVTLINQISCGIVGTEVVSIAEMIRILNVGIEELFYGQAVEELRYAFFYLQIYLQLLHYLQ
jgi:hypothetical protein